LQGVALALGPSKQPLPAFRERSYTSSTLQYGDVGENVAVIREMAPVSDEALLLLLLLLVVD
jgi:hypothetical protein